MEIIGFQRASLLDYLTTQLDHFFPDRQPVRPTLDRFVDEAIARTEVCINSARLWRTGQFSPLHSEQNTVFLYFLSNSIYRGQGDLSVATKTFYLNKALNGFSCFYDTELPEIWFVGHSPGIVLARAQYGNYLVLYQGCTVGKNHGSGPTLGMGVVMYPGSSILGNCRIGDRTVVGQGQRVIDTDTPGACYVFNEAAGIVCKQPKRSVLEDLFCL